MSLYSHGIASLILQSHLLLSFSFFAVASVLWYIISDYRKLKFPCLIEATSIEDKKQTAKDSLNAFIIMALIAAWFVGFRLFGVVPMLSYPMAIAVLVLGALSAGLMISMLIPPIRKKIEYYIRYH